MKTGFTLEILGSPAFHALHWESLKDAKQPKPFALEHVIVRKPLHFNAAYQAITPQISPTLKPRFVCIMSKLGVKSHNYNNPKSHNKNN